MIPLLLWLGSVDWRPKFDRLGDDEITSSARGSDEGGGLGEPAAVKVGAGKSERAAARGNVEGWVGGEREFDEIGRHGKREG